VCARGLNYVGFGGLSPLLVGFKLVSKVLVQGKHDLMAELARPGFKLEVEPPFGVGVLSKKHLFIYP
jgi:hypothetical protein